MRREQQTAAGLSSLVGGVRGVWCGARGRYETLRKVRHREVELRLEREIVERQEGSAGCRRAQGAGSQAARLRRS